MKTGLVLCAWLAIAAAPVRAQLDPDLEKPYRLQVVVHVADNRFLTPIFQEQFVEALSDHLQLALGPLARVEVVRTHPLLGDVLAKGLEDGLNGWEQISGLKTQFVLLDFAAGIYSLKARQYDGMTGLLSPAPRLAETADRTLVAQTAARLIEQDFGLVGTVVGSGKDIQLALKGGKLGTPLAPWVKPGDMFAISRITMEGTRQRGTRVPWALVEVLDAPRDGTCRCRLWHRFQEDDLRPLPGVLGYRCLKLTTTPGPLKLRLIDDEHLRPLSDLQVHVLKPGAAKASELTTNRDGLLVTRDSYPQFAVVRVLSGDTVRAQFPVEITGPRTVVCRLKVRPDAEGLMAIELRKDQWLRRLLDNLRLASERVADLNRELSVSMEKALATARTGLVSMESELTHLALERDQIRRQADEKMAQVDLRDGDLALGTLRKKKEDLERFVARIDDVLKEAKSATTLGLAKLLERARLLESEADFDQAIALYEKVLAASPDQAKVKDHLASLKKAWAPKDPKHAEARAFLMQDWPKFAVPDLKKNLAKAQDALTVCRDAGDKLTPLKVLQANVIHTANLKRHLDTLKRQDSEDNRLEAQAIARVIEGLRRLHAEASKKE